MEQSDNPTDTNRLIEANSPYLLQHAHNPVNWYEWGDEAFEKARSENKLVLISIGYSSCHWCHVMAHESFEDPEVARLMNENFVSIKVDREERPDVDQTYMTAVQLMTGQGGWPLNAIALPDGRPVYGGTYFPKSAWMQILQQLSAAYENNPAKFDEYAQKLTDGVKEVSLIDRSDSAGVVSEQEMNNAINRWAENFDPTYGGMNRAPKFPVPANLHFLLHYGYIKGNEAILDHVYRTLDEMAKGGIYDQVGGGFARYSTDKRWKVPHFEKMLYDNGQLMSIYSQAFRLSGNPLYQRVVEGIHSWVKREMTDEFNGFYSALDADSEGEEGKFYIWTKDELKEVLGERFELAEKIYHLDDEGLWENGQYILMLRDTPKKLARNLEMQEETFEASLQQIERDLLSARSKRVRPGLDDKVLTEWNALMISGYTEAYRAFGEEQYLEMATKAMESLLSHLYNDRKILRSRKGDKPYIDGFLNDYVFTSSALLQLYEVTGNEKWIEQSKSILETALKRFSVEDSPMCYFSEDSSKQLVSRNIEVEDNVIPSGNSTLAQLLFRIGQVYGDPRWIDRGEKATRQMKQEFLKYPGGFGQWGQMMLYTSEDFYEVAVCGDEALDVLHELQREYLPHVIFASSKSDSKIPLLEGRYEPGQNLIYVCENRSCRLPVSEPQKALEQLQPRK